MQRLDLILDSLESFHGEQGPHWPTDPYLFLVWWHCGYPPSEERCTRGWDSLRIAAGTSPEELLSAGAARLARALKAGGLVPELRAKRLNDIAHRVLDEFGGALGGALRQLSAAEARKALRKFPGIGDPGADRILLFAEIAPVAAVPSNCPHVLLRIDAGREPDKYTATYARARRTLEALVPEVFAARRRAYLLLQRHGRELCKLKNPNCGECPIAAHCAYFATTARGTPRSPKRLRQTARRARA
jgi:endonuclease-3